MNWKNKRKEKYNLQDRIEDPAIINPRDTSSSPIIMVITPSPINQENLKAYLLDLNFRVAGPFKSVDHAYMFVRRITPAIIVFDTMTSSHELVSFNQMLENDAQNIPVILISGDKNFDFNHKNYKIINPPINPTSLNDNIGVLLGKTDLESRDNQETKILEFTNKLFLKIMELVPPEAKENVEECIKRVIAQFSMRNSDFTRMSEESTTLILKDTTNIDNVMFKISLRVTIEELIEEINMTQDASWGKSLVDDAIEALVIEMKDLPDPVNDLINDLGTNADEIISSLRSAVPDIKHLNKNALVAKLSLSDLGPELKEIIYDPDSFNINFDDAIASQLITLVGQGSSYHEGIFGPLPVPKTKDLVAIIKSSLMESDIQDKRMGGKTLIVVLIGFKREIINLIPDRDSLESIFQPLDNITHSQEITIDKLQEIKNLFESQL